MDKEIICDWWVVEDLMIIGRLANVVLLFKRDRGTEKLRSHRLVSLLVV